MTFITFPNKCKKEKNKCFSIKNIIFRRNDDVPVFVDEDRRGENALDRRPGKEEEGEGEEERSEEEDRGGEGDDDAPLFDDEDEYDYEEYYYDEEDYANLVSHTLLSLHF